MRVRSLEWMTALLAGVLAAGGCSDGDAPYRSYGDLAGAVPERQPAQTDLQAASTGMPLSVPSSRDFEPESAVAEPAVAPRPAEEATVPGGEPGAAASDRVPAGAVGENGGDSPSDNGAESPSREPRVLIPEKSFSVEGPEQALRVSYDDIDLLKVLNADPVTEEALRLLPGWLKELDGRRIRIRGFMYPPPIEDGIQAFALARDNQICCFGKNPKVYDLFPVFLRPGVTTRYIFNRPFDVVGVFHIKVVTEAGMVEQVYEIDDAIVIDR